MLDLVIPKVMLHWALAKQVQCSMAAHQLEQYLFKKN